MGVGVAADRSGLLVLSEMYYPGWCAAVNGTPSLIQRVDGGLRGSRCRVDRSRIELTYARSAFTRAVLWVASHWELFSRRRCCAGGRIPRKRSASGRRTSTQTASKPSARGGGSPPGASLAARQRLSLSGIGRAWVADLPGGAGLQPMLPCHEI